MGEEIAYITEFELKEDIMESIINNEDIKIDDSLNDKLKNYELGTLLKVEKKLGLFITIISLDEVNDELSESAFNSKGNVAM